LILAHCLLCAVATADFVTDDPSVKLHFDLAKNIFVYVMSAELLVQFLYNRLSLFTNGWLVFDFIIICSAWAFPNLLVMRTFRVVRTLRLASWIKDLKQLVLALLLVIPKMFAIFFLLMILFVIFSILFTDLFKHTYEDQITDEDYFGRLDITFFTLFQIMTLDGWAEICKDIMKVYQWAWAPFVGFVVVSSFFFLNLVIAVVCEAVTSVHRDTVVKYIQDDISAATSVRDALKVEDRLEELAGSVQLMMQAQITVLETLQIQQAHLNQGGGSSGAPPGLEHEARLRKQKEELQGELDASFYGKTVQSAAKTARQRIASLNNAPGDAKDDESNERSVHLNPVPQEAALRESYMAAMSIAAEGPNEDQPMTFNSEAGPSTPAFWRQIGLTELQIARVLRAVSEQSNPTAQRPPLEAANPQRSPASPETLADQTRETRHPFS
jgi:voltage-gated sodium channel